MLVLASLGYEPGLSAAQLVTFYLLPVAWLLGTVAVWRGGAEAQVGVSVTLLSLAASLLVGEVGAALWLDARGRASRASQAPSVGAEILRMRAAGVDAFPRIGGNQVVNEGPQVRIGAEVLRPITPGPSSATIRLCDEDRPTLTYESDRYGFDNPDSAWSSRPDGVTVIGDSYAVGVCVPAADAIPGVLRRERAVLNLGMTGAGPLQELAVLREYASQVRSKTVVWVFYEGNDLWDLPREAQRAWLVSYLKPEHTQRLRERAAELNAGYRVWIDSIVRSTPEETSPPQRLNLRDVAKLTAIRTLLPVAIPFPRTGEALGLLPEIFARAKEDVASWGGELVVVYMPAYRRYRTMIGDPFPSRAKVLESLRALEIPTVDLHEAFVATGDPKSLWVTPRSHLTVAGYKVAADAIARALAAP